jgi:hypothetical protein
MTSVVKVVVDDNVAVVMLPIACNFVLFTEVYAVD